MVRLLAAMVKERATRTSTTVPRGARELVIDLLSLKRKMKVGFNLTQRLPSARTLEWESFNMPTASSR